MSDSDLYRRSSQYRLWSFSRSELALLASEAHASADKTESTGERLTLEEERKLVIFFAAVQTKPLCELFKLPSQVLTTSVAYFRRFYLRHSVMEFEPKLILTTCVYLAAKAENAYISIKSFCEALKKVEPQDILDLEFPVLRTLNFTLQVHSALRSLHGFFLDMQARLSNGYPLNELGAIHEAARGIVLETLVSDAYFHYTPSQIALAALMEANELAATEYAAESLSGGGMELPQTLALVAECRQLLMEPVPQRDECLAISKKLRLFYKGMAQKPTEEASSNDPVAKQQEKRARTD